MGPGEGACRARGLLAGSWYPRTGHWPRRGLGAGGGTTGGCRVSPSSLGSLRRTASLASVGLSCLLLAAVFPAVGLSWVLLSVTFGGRAEGAVSEATAQRVQEFPGLLGGTSSGRSVPHSCPGRPFTEGRVCSSLGRSVGRREGGVPEGGPRGEDEPREGRLPAAPGTASGLLAKDLSWADPPVPSGQDSGSAPGRSTSRVWEALSQPRAGVGGGWAQAALLCGPGTPLPRSLCARSPCLRA